MSSIQKVTATPTSEIWEEILECDSSIKPLDLPAQLPPTPADPSANQTSLFELQARIAEHVMMQASFAKKEGRLLAVENMFLSNINSFTIPYFRVLFTALAVDSCDATSQKINAVKILTTIKLIKEALHLKCDDKKLTTKLHGHLFAFYQKLVNLNEEALTTDVKNSPIYKKTYVEAALIVGTSALDQNQLDSANWLLLQGLPLCLEGNNLECLNDLCIELVLSFMQQGDETRAKCYFELLCQSFKITAPEYPSEFEALFLQFLNVKDNENHMILQRRRDFLHQLFRKAK